MIFRSLNSNITPKALLIKKDLKIKLKTYLMTKILISISMMQKDINFLTYFKVNNKKNKPNKLYRDKISNFKINRPNKLNRQKAFYLRSL